MEKFKKSEKNGLNDFRIKIKRPGEEPHSIPHKNQVKYLGVILDSRLRLTSHPRTQLEKARRAFAALGNLFSTATLTQKPNLYAIYSSDQ